MATYESGKANIITGSHNQTHGLCKLIYKYIKFSRFLYDIKGFCIVLFIQAKVY